jgi:hypothetical protein
MKDKTWLYSRKIFLVDAAGAALSTLFLGFVMIRWQEFFGMPIEVLACLALVAFLLFIYSYTCYRQASDNWAWFLKMVARANFSYLTVTLLCILYWWHALTAWGKAYFLGEAIIVIVLALHEMRVARRQAA